MQWSYSTPKLSSELKFPNSHEVLTAQTGTWQEPSPTCQLLYVTILGVATQVHNEPGLTAPLSPP